METALTEITLVLFTTIAPAGLVGYGVMALYSLVASERAQAEAASRYLVVPLVLVITGLIASATHLGTPANALYVLAGVGRSPLANEVIAVVAFLVAGGAWWMVSFRDDITLGVRRAAVAVVLLAALVALYFISVAYSVPWIPTWALPTVPLTLFLNALVSGVVVGLLGLAVARQQPSPRFVAAALVVAAVAAVANGAVLLVQWHELAAIETTLVAAPDLVPWTPAAIGGFLVLSLAALALCAVAERCRKARRGVPSEKNALVAGASEGAAPASVRRGRPLLLGAAVLLVLVACFLVRFTFYAMRMTVGV
ncbi:DmsC/YnfH family molybdoenzyme membrane anchor subunit [uncultured Adlercreutzia sp.]|uniref:dimethyl sulfoxide reductase anchor subunit family protein n=2 Tax=uncultured Adlercreutzia sp. TaxID=875803 RepID=UPI0025F62EE6|nr:DmsC/YnfH family molybdoenzyme membrane anchor subunit [uncultured Adlercreutzia sp.]MCI9261797.1 dimethyl sulfoxide reductase anchor subunit [Eggerthellaceae bacterium]